MKMSIPWKSLPIFYLSATVMLFGGASHSVDSPLEMLARVTASIQSRNTEAIKMAYNEAARYINEPTPHVWNTLPRREKLIFSLRMVDGLASCIDKSSAPKERAYLNVGAPGVPIAGMDPKQIADPVIRKEYERRIAKNSQIIEQLGAQSLFQILKKTWTRHVQYLASQHYGKDIDELAEIKNLLASTVSDAPLRTELEQLLGIEGK